MKKNIFTIALLISFLCLSACSRPFTATEETINNEQDQEEMNQLMEQTQESFSK